MNKPNAGAKRLRAALRRLARSRPLGAPSGPAPQPAPQPATDWENMAEIRLTAIERTLNNQNRLLLITIISIAADAIYRVASQ